MNREIKFRAWDEGNGIMHSNVEFIRSGIKGNDWIIFKSDKQALSSGCVLDNPYLQQQIKLMQYTGLKDKNGVEIYEGDILTDGEEYGCILWFNDNCEFVLHHQDYIDEYDYNPGCDVNTPDGWVGLKIVGNIYENPELLEGSENE